MQTFNSGILSNVEKGIRKDEASKGVNISGTTPVPPISRNLL